MCPQAGEAVCELEFLVPQEILREGGRCSTLRRTFQNRSVRPDFGRSRRAPVLAGRFGPRGGRALALSKNLPLGAEGELGARPIFRPFSLGRELGSARKISGFSAAAPRNFRGVSFARPSPNREAAAVPNAIQLKRLPARRKRGSLRGLEIRWRAMAAQGGRVLGLAPGICRPHGSRSTNERFPTAVPGAHGPRPNRLEAPKNHHGGALEEGSAGSLGGFRFALGFVPQTFPAILRQRRVSGTDGGRFREGILLGL